MSQHAEPSIPATETPHTMDIPETNDPAVLRELLRQAREHLRARESIEQLMADNIARTEALLIEARAHGDIDRDELGQAIATVRATLQEAMTALDRMSAILNHTPTPSTDGTAFTNPAPRNEPRRIEVLIHNVHTAALARSVQQHLLEVEGITGAEVRELAEGLLRITVTSTEPITGASLADWDPGRGRTIRTSSASVLEIELEVDS